MKVGKIFFILFIVITSFTTYVLFAKTLDEQLLETAKKIIVTKNKVNIIRDLIEKGANVNAKDKSGNTALMLVAMQKIKGEVSIPKQLIATEKERKFDPSLYARKLRQQDYYVKELYDRTFVNDYDAVELLLAKGADINLQNNEGKTALMFAAIRGDLHTTSEGPPMTLPHTISIVELLLHNFPNPDIRDNAGKTALDYAKENKNKSVIERLKRVTTTPTIGKKLKGIFKK